MCIEQDTVTSEQNAESTEQNATSSPLPRFVGEITIETLQKIRWLEHATKMNAAAVELVSDKHLEDVMLRRIILVDGITSSFLPKWKF